MNAAVSAAVAVQFRRTIQLLAVGGPSQVLYRDGEGFITAERLPVSEGFRNPELLQHRGQKPERDQEGNS